MRIHKEGYCIITTNFIIIAIIVTSLHYFFGNNICTYIADGVGITLFLFVASFFRSPKRISIIDENIIAAPADGKIVIIQNVFENEYLKEEVIQVSVFMSVFNVHVNWFPIGGIVEYYKYHAGKYMVAWHPKSSEKNERTTTVIKTNSGVKVLYRQIAGLVARRIVCYSKVGQHFNQCSELGFIKFGSRIDLFLPKDSEIAVKIGQKVTGCETIIAKLPKAHKAE